jgi:Tfp pilus assembly protein PilF
VQESDYVLITAWLPPLRSSSASSCLSAFAPRTLWFQPAATSQVPKLRTLSQGTVFWNRRTHDDLTKAVDYFTQAIVKDPNDVQAYVGLADCYNLLREFGAMPPGEAYPRALSAAQRAVGLDDTSAEAHNSLAFATYWWLWEVTAEREFKRALELNPNLALAHHWYATFSLSRNRLQKQSIRLNRHKSLNLLRPPSRPTKG